MSTLGDYYTAGQSETVSGEVATTADIHDDEVLDWRQRRFRELGFVPYVADVLAESRVDLHQMGALLGKGCSHDLAAQILVGTMWSGEDPSAYTGFASEGVTELPVASQGPSDDDDETPAHWPTGAPSPPKPPL